MSLPRPRIAIVGAGISGLSAAVRLTQAPSAPRVTLFDPANRPGGVLETERIDGYLIERSADSFLVNAQLPWAERLATATDYEGLLEPQQAHQRALLLSRGRLHPVPEGFYLAAAVDLRSVLRSRLLSWQGKLALAWERFVAPRSDNADESLADFARRRVGREVFERLVQPLVSGIYSADPEHLSMAAALPQLVEMERSHGSLTAGLQQRRGEIRTSAGARYAMFRAPREGMGHFVAHLAARLPAGCLRLRSPVSAISHHPGDRWQISSLDKSEVFDGLILATPTAISGRLLATVAPRLANELSEIPAASVAIVSLGYERAQVAHPLDAFGLVVPDVEQRDLVAISFASNKFAGRAPAGHVLLRVFLGGALRPEVLERDDAELAELAVKQVQEILGASGKPQLTLTTRWTQATPQYHVGHLARIARIEQELASHPPLALAGSGYRGIGIPQCIRSGFTAADRVVSQLELPRTDPSSASY